MSSGLRWLHLRSGYGPTTSPMGLALAVGMGVMAEAVDQHRGELRVDEDLDPLGKRDVGGDNRRAAVVEVGEQV